jgi:uncharacterized membrane protein YphA (DoxX/SURF4 family)
MKKTLHYFIPMLVAFTPAAPAHVRWFVNGRDIPDVSFRIDTINLLTLIGAIIYVLVTYYLFRITLGQQHSSEPSLLKRGAVTGLQKVISLPFHMDWYLLVLLVNLLLVINLMMGDFLAPNLLLPPQWIMLGVIVQIAAILLSSLSISITGLALIVVAVFLPLVFPTAVGFDYFFEVSGVGLAYLCIAPCISQFDHHFYQRFNLIGRYDKQQLRDAAVRVLRIAMGLQLMMLAVNNKLMEPGAMLLFLQDYPFYNFMQALGVESYTHLHFVFAGGIVELTFGAMLVLGWAPRFVALCLVSVFFITAVVSGVAEVIGHLPIFGVLWILVAAGRHAEGNFRWSPSAQTAGGAEIAK